MKLTDFLEGVGRPVAYHPGLKKITGSTTATIMLCQFIYWRGKESDPDGWLYKSSEDIEGETGLSYDEQKTARKKLVGLGFMEEYYARLDHQMKFRLNLNAINDAWGKAVFNIPESGNTALGKAVSHDSLNESETTSETTTKNVQIPDPVCEACGEPTSKLIQASYKGNYFKVCSTCDIIGSLPKALRPDKNAHAKNVINAMGVFETKTRSIEDDCRVYLNYTPDWKVKANGELMSFLIEQKRIGHMVEEFSRWYWAVFWKGQKGQPPTSKDIRENWYAAFGSAPAQTQKANILQGMSPA